MTKTDRAEVKEMLHDILSGYQARNESVINTTNISLGKIDTHLENLNGKVAQHEKFVNGSKAVLRFIVVGIPLAGLVFGIVYKLLIQ